MSASPKMAAVRVMLSEQMYQRNAHVPCILYKNAERKEAKFCEDQEIWGMQPIKCRDVSAQETEMTYYVPCNFEASYTCQLLPVTLLVFTVEYKGELRKRLSRVFVILL